MVNTPLTSPWRCLHASNLLTYASLGTALGAAACASHGNATGAGILVASSVLADTFDGRFARAFTRDEPQRAFGGELDSLSDAIAFGVVPVVCLALLGRPVGSGALEALWWIAAFLYAACAITRLGFYNLAHQAVDGFVGMPAPLAALVWATVLPWNPNAAVWTAVFVVTGLAMVAPVPVPRPRGLGLAAFAAWPVVLIALQVLGR
jgi:CDP-diacylglycerol--serine O-phosphatidyltransferase